MADPVLTVITQVEIDLEALVQAIPNPSTQVAPPSSDPNYNAWVMIESNLQGYASGMGSPTSNLSAVASLLTALYKIKFVEDIGKAIPELLDKVRNILIDVADKLGPTGPVGNVNDLAAAVAGIKTFLNAIQKLPGSPQGLTEASDVLMQIVGLLNDIPSTRLELFKIAQQIQVFRDTFANA